MNFFLKHQLNCINRLLDRWLTRRASQVRMPEALSATEDVPYLHTGKACHRMDIYRPAQAAGPLPVIVNLHGGGMVLCSKAVNRPFCWELARRGFLVFNLDYPLVPQSDVPGILRTLARGMDRVDGLLESCGGDRERVYLVGDSAGAFISVYAAAAQRNPDLAAAIPLTPSSLPVRALGLISGMYYTARADSTGFFLRKDFYGRHWRRHPMAPFLRPHKPCVAAHLPPCFLVTSKSDNLHSYTLKFHKGLVKAGTPCPLLDHGRLKNLQHDFPIVNPESRASQNVIDKMCEFLLRH